MGISAALIRYYQINAKKVGRYRLRQMLHNNRDIISILINHCQINVIIEHKITTQKQMKWKYPGVLRAF